MSVVSRRNEAGVVVAACCYAFSRRSSSSPTPSIPCVLYFHAPWLPAARTARRVFLGVAAAASVPEPCLSFPFALVCSGSSFPDPSSGKYLVLGQAPWATHACMVDCAY